MAASPASAEPFDDLKDELIKEGFENVAIAHEDGLTTIWFESRRRFSRVRSLGEALAIASKHLPQERLRAIPLTNQMPVLAVETHASDLAAWRAGTLAEPDFQSRLVFSTPTDPPQALNTSAGRVDLQLFPSLDIYGRNGFRYLLVEKLSGTLAPGLSYLTRSEISQEGFTDARWSYGVLRYGRWLASETMVTATAGSYGWGHWGGALELARYFDEGQTCLRLGAGDSTRVLPQFTASVERYVPLLDSTLTVGYGRFFLGDQGPFAKATRWFSRSFLEAGGFRTQLGTQLRLTFGINFGPDPLPEPAPLRVFGPGWFESEYRASRPLAGNTLWPEPNANDTVQRLVPAYVRAHLHEWRD